MSSCMLRLQPGTFAFKQIPRSEIYATRMCGLRAGPAEAARGRASASTTKQQHAAARLPQTFVLIYYCDFGCSRALLIAPFALEKQKLF